MPVAERVAVLRRLAAVIDERAPELAALTTDEVGVAARFAGGHPIGAATVARLTAAAMEEFPLSGLCTGPLGRSLVVHEPVGVVAAVIPWNGPLVHGLMKVAAPLAAGCTVVLKPPPDTVLSGYALAACLEAAGAPTGVVTILPGDREAGRHLLGHRGIDHISFTGSTGAGRQVAVAAAAELRRCHLELGGKSAAILCRPLISAAQRDRVEGYLRLAREEGTQVVSGGGRPAHLERGFFVEPTVLAGVDNRMRVAREEIFGPVVSVIRYTDDDDAVRIANDSPYGLSGAVFTADPQRAMRIARRIAAGTVTLNGFWLNMAAPFGGYKHSGVGREFGAEGLAEYFELKSINLDHDQHHPRQPPRR